MNRRLYEALGLHPLTSSGHRCGSVTGAGYRCTRWAQWRDHDSETGALPLCSQHATRTAEQRLEDPARGAALARTRHKVTYTVVVSGPDAEVYRNGVRAAQLRAEPDGTFTGLDDLLSNR